MPAMNTSSVSSPPERRRLSCWATLPISIVINSTLQPIFSRVISLSFSATASASGGVVPQTTIREMVGTSPSVEAVFQMSRCLQIDCLQNCSRCSHSRILQLQGRTAPVELPKSFSLTFCTSVKFCFSPLAQYLRKRLLYTAILSRCL